MRCAYCYETSKGSEALTVKRTLAVLHKLYEIDPQPSMVEILGGEPLLNWASLQTIVSYCKGNGTRLSTVTNGVLLTPDKIAFLNQAKVLVGISYDGKSAHDLFRKTKNGRGTEEIVRKNIETSLANGLPLIVCMTFHKGNASFIENDIEDMCSWGVCNFRIYTVHKNKFAVTANRRYSIYNRLLSLSRAKNVSIVLNMDYSKMEDDIYFYYDDKVKVQTPGMLGNWAVTGWD
jgi:sulfatase maturation enzyme AslB (radical SAM superfamily)